MKYTLTYVQTNEKITSNKTLTIYDFGNIKGFLYDNDFIMYKILERNDNYEICEDYDENIPLNVFSIETYDCLLENNAYKMNDIVIEISRQPSQPSEQQQPHQKHQRQQQPPLRQVRPQQPFPQEPQHQQRNTQRTLIRREAPKDEKYKKTQRVELNLQVPLEQPIVQQQNQWMSLGALMQLPLPGVGQGVNLQSVVKDQNSSALSQQKRSLRVRLPQKILLKQHQDSNS
jgi:hypothetical protein